MNWYESHKLRLLKEKISADVRAQAKDVARIFACLKIKTASTEKRDLLLRIDPALAAKYVIKLRLVKPTASMPSSKNAGPGQNGSNLLDVKGRNFPSVSNGPLLDMTCNDIPDYQEETLTLPGHQNRDPD